MVIEDRHDLSVPEGVDDGGKDVLGRGVGDKGVLVEDLGVDLRKGVGRDVGIGGAGGKRLLDEHARVQRVVDRVREPHAVEALLLDEVGDEVDGLLVQALGDVGLHVPRPVDAPELDPVAGVVEDPSAVRLQRELLGRRAEHEARNSD